MRILLILFIALSIFVGCSSSENKIAKELYGQGSDVKEMFVNSQSSASSPFLTKNQQDKAVLCWTEGSGENAYLYYSVVDNKGAFSKPIQVKSSKGLSVHAEGMAKLAFKSDGTVVAVYGKRKPTKDNPFAGALYYTQSFDRGKTWTEPFFLHRDTSKNVGRNFVDLTTMGDGEVGAVWLDGRDRDMKGSTLYFAKTSKKNGFVDEIKIANSVCQCCRTDLFIDEKKQLHIAYRDIFYDSIRDMAYIHSKDHGRSFTSPVRISEDNWVIDGCPHTGPSMTSNGRSLNFVWYTQGGKGGVYHCSTSDNGKSFSQRALLSEHASHPQICSLKGGKLAVVWDEIVKRKDGAFTNCIKLWIEGKEDLIQLSSPLETSDHPVLLVDDGDLIVAWTQSDIETKKVVYKRVKIT